MNTTEFVKKHNITISALRIKRNPNMQNEEWSKDASHWDCTLSLGQSKPTLNIYYSMGSAHKGNPKADDVLDCLAMDASSVDNARNFEDWASEYGYDTDSRKAERTYNICVDEANKLKEFLGHKLYKELLEETERL